VEIGCRVDKSRRPRDSPLYRLVERHLEELLRVWPERFARRHGPLRAVVERVLREFLRCGLLEHGFVRSGAASAEGAYWSPSPAAAAASAPPHGLTCQGDDFKTDDGTVLRSRSVSLRDIASILRTMPLSFLRLAIHSSQSRA
jgi:hypothetical protein